MLSILRHQRQKLRSFVELHRATMSTMQEANRLQKALTKGGPTFGAWQVNGQSRYIRD
jgi:hypothetical protein